MRRLHLFELEDQPWFPVPIRDAMTGGLRTFAEKFGFAAAIAEHLAPAVRASGQAELIDLCAGAGGPTVAVLDALAAAGLSTHVTLTDLFPNVAAFERVSAESGGRIGYREDSIDATAVPADLPGFRLVFNAFHHLPPPVAQGVLADAMRAGQPIAVYEIIGRDPLAMASMLGAPLAMLGIVPTLRPFDWRWVPLTYLFPVIPLCSGWDAMVSCLRIYDQRELAELVAPLQRPGWRWQIGRFRMGGLPLRATWLWGGLTGEPEGAP